MPPAGICPSVASTSHKTQITLPTHYAICIMKSGSLDDDDEPALDRDIGIWLQISSCRGLSKSLTSTSSCHVRKWTKESHSVALSLKASEPFSRYKRINDDDKACSPTLRNVKSTIFSLVIMTNFSFQLDPEDDEHVQGLERDFEEQQSLDERDSRLSKRRQQEELEKELFKSCESLLNKWKGILKSRMNAIRSHLESKPQLPPCEDTELWLLVEECKKDMSRCYVEYKALELKMYNVGHEPEAQYVFDMLGKLVLDECSLPDFPMLDGALCKPWIDAPKLTEEEWQGWLKKLKSQKSRQASDKPTDKQRKRVVHPPPREAAPADTASENSAGSSRTKETKDSKGTTVTKAVSSVLPPATDTSGAPTSVAASNETLPDSLAATTMPFSNLNI
jgi:hypothetical protein